MRGEQDDSADLRDKSAKEGEVLLMMGGQKESAKDFVDKQKEDPLIQNQLQL